MKILIGTIVFVLASVNLSYSQGATDFIRAKKEVKAEAIANGYSLLDEGGIFTNNNEAIQFDINTFYKGYQYLVLTVVDDCLGCMVNFVSKDYSSNVVNNKTTKMKFKNYIGISITSFTQTDTGNGHLQVYVDETLNHTTWTMLFRKPK